MHVSYDHVISKIKFINEELIPLPVWQESENLVADIDVDDIDFVALKTFINGKLWTGDKPLYNGLRAKNVEGIFNTVELLKLRDELYNQQKP